MRLCAALIASLAMSCATTPPVASEVVFPGTPSQQHDGTSFYGPLSVGSRLATASGPVFLYLENVTIEPGSEAELYLVSPSLQIEETNYIGSVGTVVGNPDFLPVVVQEINDFEADGKQYRARTTLRGNSSVGVALVVKKGAVKVERLVLTTASLDDRR